MFFFRAVADDQNTFETHAYALFHQEEGSRATTEEGSIKQVLEPHWKGKIERGSTTNHRTDIELNCIEAYVSSWKSVLFILVVRCI